MSIRKMLPVMMVAVALLAASAAFAADAPAVPMSQEQFLTSLQTPDTSTSELTIFHPVGSVPTPEMKHGSNCSALFQCRSCPQGYEACDVYRCWYNGGWHNHYYCSGYCSNPCAT